MAEIIKLKAAPFPPPYGKSPAMTALEDLRSLNRGFAFLLTEEAHQLILAESFWEHRKVRGLLAVFSLGHNLHCHFRAQVHRDKLKRLIEKEMKNG